MMCNSCYNIQRKAMMIQSRLRRGGVGAEPEVYWDFGQPKGIPGRKGCRVWAYAGMEMCKICLM